MRPHPVTLRRSKAARSPLEDPKSANTPVAHDCRTSPRRNTGFLLRHPSVAMHEQRLSTEKPAIEAFGWHLKKKGATDWNGAVALEEIGRWRSSHAASFYACQKRTCVVETVRSGGRPAIRFRPIPSLPHRASRKIVSSGNWLHCLGASPDLCSDWRLCQRRGVGSSPQERGNLIQASAAAASDVRARYGPRVSADITRTGDPFGRPLAHRCRTR